jgi:hypothetical protein
MGLGLFVVSLPPRVRVEEPFTVRFMYTNDNTADDQRVYQLQSVKPKMTSILLAGSTTVMVSGQRQEVELQFFPLLSGLHPILGLRLVDPTSGHVVREFGSLCEIFVEHDGMDGDDGDDGNVGNAVVTSTLGNENDHSKPGFSPIIPGTSLI